MIKGFITNLGKYNEGQLVGEWISFPIDEDEIKEVLLRIGINDEYEESFFTDWETEVPVSLGEYESIDTVNELAEALESEDGDMLAAIIEATGYKLEEALAYVDRATFYSGVTMDELAYDFVAEMGLPDFALSYFDYEAFARDLGFDGYTEVSNGVIYLG